MLVPEDLYVSFGDYFCCRELKEGKNILLSSSGNAFRALIKSLENLSEEEIANTEFGIGEAYVYEIDKDGKVINKEIRNKNPLAGKQ